jgi:hypothetical protein
LKECANAPNNKQTAIAQSAIEVLQKYPQQVLVVKGGQGKSRIAAMIAFIAVETGVAERVHMVYTNRILKEKDQDDFKQLWSISGHVDAVAEDVLLQHVGAGERAHEGRRPVVALERAAVAGNGVPALDVDEELAQVGDDVHAESAVKVAALAVH